MRRWTTAWLWGPVALAAGALIVIGLVNGWFLGPQEPQMTAEERQGRAVYLANCAQCHGERGEGAANWRTPNPDGTFLPPPHDVTGHTWHHGDGLLYRIVSEGGTIVESPGFKSAMPGFAGQLSPEEVRAVIAYMKSMWGPRERGFQAEVSRQDPFPPMP